MPDFKYALGDTVLVDPAAMGDGLPGKIVGLVTYIDGGTAYVVSSLDKATLCAVRRTLHECELTPVASN